MALSHRVAPRTGAWIETNSPIYRRVNNQVAPRTGAWIETKKPKRKSKSLQSHPARVRGLKLGEKVFNDYKRKVAPRTGAWIETSTDGETFSKSKSRTPHGCVD